MKEKERKNAHLERKKFRIEVLKDIAPTRKGQEAYRIISIRDFLYSSMDDVDIVLAINLWYESRCENEKFYAIYNNVTFNMKQKNLWIVSPLRDILLIDDTKNVRKLCKYAEKAMTYNLDWLKLEQADAYNFFRRGDVHNYSSEVDLATFRKYWTSTNLYGVKVDNEGKKVTLIPLDERDSEKRITLSVVDDKVIIYEKKINPNQVAKNAAGLKDTGKKGYRK